MELSDLVSLHSEKSQKDTFHMLGLGHLRPCTYIFLIRFQTQQMVLQSLKTSGHVGGISTRNRVELWTVPSSPTLWAVWTASNQRNIFPGSVWSTLRSEGERIQAFIKMASLKIVFCLGVCLSTWVTTIAGNNTWLAYTTCLQNCLVVTCVTCTFSNTRI